MKAEEFPRQSHEDIAQNGPNEQHFQQMEVVAATGGVEAEARRREMARYAEKVGILAEKGARMQRGKETQLLHAGHTAETIHNANQGLSMMIKNEGLGNDTTLRPVSSGVEVVDWEVHAKGEDDVELKSTVRALYRSPDKIKQSK